MKKNIIIVLVLILVVWGLAELGKSNQKNQEKQTQTIETKEIVERNGVLTADSYSYDFGDISMKDGLVEYVFNIENTTNTDIFVEKVATSCMCTTAFLESNDVNEKGPFGMEGMGYLPPANELIKSGESRKVRIVYDPNAHGPAGVGYIEMFIKLVDDQGNALELEIKAVVRP